MNDKIEGKVRGSRTAMCDGLKMYVSRTGCVLCLFPVYHIAIFITYCLNICLNMWINNSELTAGLIVCNIYHLLFKHMFKHVDQ